MSFSVTNQFTGASILDPAKLDENFSDVAAVLNGGFTNANIASGAAIANGKLANDDFLFTVDFRLTGGAGDWAAATPFAVAAIPRVATDTFKILGYQYYMTDQGTATSTFSIQTGNVSAGAWSGSNVITTNINGSSDGAHIAGQSTISSQTIVTSAATSMFLAVRVTTKGANAMTAITDFFHVSVLCSRSSGLGQF